MVLANRNNSPVVKAFLYIFKCFNMQEYLDANNQSIYFKGIMLASVGVWAMTEAILNLPVRLFSLWIIIAIGLDSAVGVCNACYVRGEPFKPKKLLPSLGYIAYLITLVILLSLLKYTISMVPLAYFGEVFTAAFEYLFICCIAIFGLGLTINVLRNGAEAKIPGCAALAKILRIKLKEIEENGKFN